ncbi:MAG: 2-phospho-L-lactate guanylyltransferase [Methanosphaera sp.]|uniref:2-phospho-L-lactate guanylyltransferase n=1 Tax=Methanosphaera sp. TaxID=2666342 RepID=UPI0025FCE04E|nr:2-phospho-L-lactate guanylyltransferase [Methanosphaera sp.]MCI5866943.1 2-phospho-L-lactate guanylyltransferase [Methanosphaera sp.]MDD6535098.1 2-phospho-L-lactate guanylyltransferase [Methanosphaera sp.]MDY3955907.1 2-phospho-L-lactate guanylyltransferase [Methanosphaera sp.]
MNNLVVIIPVSSFNTSKTRLSPFLSEDERKNLLKCMLKDIVKNITGVVEEIIITSKDSEVLDFGCDLNLTTFMEHEHSGNYLNCALLDCINFAKCEFEYCDIVIVPADIPLITRSNIEYIKDHDVYDFIIAPSRGGGTNMLYFKGKYDFIPKFGEFSFFKHIDEAEDLGCRVNVYDSFFLSLDINTPQDLGELLLHGKLTDTYMYLKKLGVNVLNNHGKERLYVFRED